MGDENKNKENTKNNKEKEKNKNGSCYSGSNSTWSSRDSACHSGESDDDRQVRQDGERDYDKKKRPSKNRKKERTKRGKISKPKGRAKKMVDNQTQRRRLADDMYMEGPSKVLSICSVASTIASSRSAYSNDGHASETDVKNGSELSREERKLFVSLLLEKMRAARKSMKIAINDESNDNKAVELIEVDEDDDNESMNDKSDDNNDLERIEDYEDDDNGSTNEN